MADPARRRRRTRRADQPDDDAVGCAERNGRQVGEADQRAEPGRRQGNPGSRHEPTSRQGGDPGGRSREPVVRSDRDGSAAERGLRGLVGGGSSQIGRDAAMRARDAARPTIEDLEASATELTIVRRGWIPKEELPRPGRT